MRIISFGDLYVDYYFKNDELIGLSGGKTNANIIANLSHAFKTAFIGVVGNDDLGDIAINTLSELGVDTKNIRKIEGKTKTYFINEKGVSKECPYCHRISGYHGLKTEIDDVAPYIKEDDIFIIDNINKVTMDILKMFNNPAFLDIASVSSIIYHSLDEITNMLANRFKIINMNERAYKVFKRKFDIDSEDLYELLKPDILIITRGKRGCDILSKEGFIKKEIDNPVKEVDPNGAGDAFFGEFIRIYIEENDEVNDKMLSKAYIKAQASAAHVVSLMGSRTHLLALKKIIEYNECICQRIKVK